MTTAIGCSYLVTRIAGLPQQIAGKSPLIVGRWR